MAKEPVYVPVISTGNGGVAKVHCITKAAGRSVLYIPRPLLPLNLSSSHPNTITIV